MLVRNLPWAEQTINDDISRYIRGGMDYIPRYSVVFQVPFRLSFCEKRACVMALFS